MLIGLFLVIVGTLCHLPLVFPVHLVGVFFQRGGMGMLLVTHPRYLQDYVPNRILGFCLGTIAIAMQIAQMLAVASCSMLPPEKDTDALAADRNWRIVMVMPGVIATIAILM